jgi:5-methyltetrahydropteroyltriglutamate--homocysteine methyltransferase
MELADDLARGFGRRQDSVPRLDCAILARLPDKQIILGVLDPGAMAVETPALVAEHIRRALAYVAPERLIVAPDCGLKYLPREVAFAKLAAMVAAAAIVRRELGG